MMLVSKLTSSVGNHDRLLEDPQARTDLLRQYPSLTFLNHETASIRLQRTEGPKTYFKVFGSPYSPAKGSWAFGYEPDRANALWSGSIALDTDIVITHTPPKSHCDESRGCESLRQRLGCVRPLLSICGHVHEGRGAERILWDLGTSEHPYQEHRVGFWQDPGADNKKQSLIDLSSKSSAALNNRKLSGSKGKGVGETITDFKNPTTHIPPYWIYETRQISDTNNHMISNHLQFVSQSREVEVNPKSSDPAADALGTRWRETCIINAAIMSTSWPYKTRNNRKYNKPIVVDVDLPIWQDRIEH